MYVAFENLPDDSRIWVYLSERKIEGDDFDWMSSALTSFLEKWTAHGNNLQASYTFLHGHILVIGLNEDVADASGCSIDSSVHFIQGMGAHLKTDFFNRTLVPFVDSNTANLIPLNDIKSGLSTQKILGNAIIFNTLIAKKKDLETAHTQLKDSWLNRYLKIQDITA